MIKAKLFFFIISIYVPASLYGFAQTPKQQNKLDSLHSVLHQVKSKALKTELLLELCDYFKNSKSYNLDSLSYYANKALDFTKNNTNLNKQNVKALNYLSYHAYKTEKFNEAKAYNAQVKSISEKLNYGMGLRQASLRSGFISEKENSPSLAIFYFENAYSIAKDYKLPKNIIFKTALELSSAYLRNEFPKEDIANILFEIADTVEGPEILNTPLESSSAYLRNEFPKEDIASTLYKNRGFVQDLGIDIEDQALFYFNLGSFYNRYNNEQEKAVEYYNKSIILFRTHHASGKLHEPLIKLSESYQKLGQHKKAIELLNRYLNSETTAQQGDIYPRIYYGLGVSYLETRNYTASEFNFNKAIIEHKKNNNHISKADCLQQIGHLYSRQKNGQKAEANFTRAIESYKTGISQLQKELPLEPKIAHAYQQISSIYEVNKNYKESAVYYVLYDKAKTRIEAAKLLKLTERLGYIKEEIAKEKEIELLEKGNNIKEIEAENGKYLEIGLGLFLALAVVLVFILDNRYNLKQRAVQIFDKKNEEKKLLIREIHHRVKNNLQIISSLLGVQISGSTDDNLKLILQESQNKVRSMALIHQNLYNTDQFTKVSAAKYINELVTEIKRSFDNKDHAIKLEIDIEDTKVQLDFALPLGLILNELINNSYKHAFKDRGENKNLISVSFYKLKNTTSYALSVKDNGIGLPDDFDIDKLDSFGFKLVQSLAEQLRGEISIFGQHGTTVDITFKNVGQH